MGSSIEKRSTACLISSQTILALSFELSADGYNVSKRSRVEQSRLFAGLQERAQESEGRRSPVTPCKTIVEDQRKKAQTDRDGKARAYARAPLVLQTG